MTPPAEVCRPGASSNPHDEPASTPPLNRLPRVLRRSTSSPPFTARSRQAGANPLNSPSQVLWSMLKCTEQRERTRRSIRKLGDYEQADATSALVRTVSSRAGEPAKVRTPSNIARGAACMKDFMTHKSIRKHGLHLGIMPEAAAAENGSTLLTLDHDLDILPEAGRRLTVVELADHVDDLAGRLWAAGSGLGSASLSTSPPTSTSGCSPPRRRASERELAGGMRVRGHEDDSQGSRRHTTGRHRRPGHPVRDEDRLNRNPAVCFDDLGGAVDRAC